MGDTVSFLWQDTREAGETAHPSLSRTASDLLFPFVPPRGNYFYAAIASSFWYQFRVMIQAKCTEEWI